MADRPWRKDTSGLVLTVRLTPKAARDEIGGPATLSDGRRVLAARVRAVPEKGAANRALADLLARALKAPKRSVAIVSGATARVKTVRIGGDPDALEAALARLLAETGDTS